MSMKNIISFTNRQKVHIKRASGFLSRLGWITPQGQFYGCKRGELHCDTARRYITETETKNKNKNKEQLRSILQQFKKLIMDQEYTETYKFMASKYDLIRVTDRGFDFPSLSPECLNRAVGFIKSANYPPDAKLTFASSLQNNSGVDVKMETIINSNYDLHAAISRNAQSERAVPSGYNYYQPPEQY